MVHHNLYFKLFILHNNSFDNQGSKINKIYTLERFSILFTCFSYTLVTGIKEGCKCLSSKISFTILNKTLKLKKKTNKQRNKKNQNNQKKTELVDRGACIKV